MSYFSSWLLPRARKDYLEAVEYGRQCISSDPIGVAEAQLRRIQDVWADCSNYVLYYRNLVQHGEAPKEIRSWDDFRMIPLLDRRTLQERCEEFKRTDSHPDEFRMTGGSTGEPVRLGVWKEESHPQRVAKLVLWQRCGYEPSKRLLLIWGHSHLLGTGWRGRLNHVLRKAKDRLIGYERIDAYSLSPAKCEGIARGIIASRPFGLIGYASALDYFVRVTEQYHEELGRAGVGFVMPASEMPPRPDSFELLGRVFRCPVVQEFAGVEFGQVAMKYQDEPFKVFDHLNYVETMSKSPNEDGAGERVALTSLTRRYAPLIRYVQGDAISGVRRLANGHVTSFDHLAGRTHDVVRLPDGCLLHSMGILHCIHQEPSILNIQLLVSDDGMKLRLATSSQFDDACEQRIRRRLSQISHHLGKIPFERVVDVETTVAGKRRWIVDTRTQKELPTTACPQ